MSYSFENGYVISCEDYAKKIKEDLKTDISNFEVKPTLLVIQVGDNPASNSYIKGKFKDCEEVGIIYSHMHFDSDIDEESLIKCIKECNEDSNVNGIIVQLPLPEHLDADRVTQCIAKEKDVDGFKVDSLFNPCTPKGVVDWLEYNNYNFEGKGVTVIGRSNIVGKPLVNMLIDKGATVTCCNSKTKNLEDYTRWCDLLISAVGKPKMIDDYYIIHSKIIVDIGINRDEDGKLCGDVDKEEILEYLSHVYITPVPKGVGLLTRAALLQNVFKAYVMQRG